MDPFGASNADLESIITEHTNTFQQIRQAAKEHALLASQVATDPLGQHAPIDGGLKEQEKKKSTVKKDKSKGRSSKGKASASQATEFPGAIPGQEANASALWLAAESYFRDVTAEDILWLCPSHDDPYEDPIFHVPYLGPPYESLEEQEARAKQQASLTLKPRSRNRHPLNDVVSPGSLEPPGSADKQRKSSRLGAKAASRIEEAGGLSPRAAGETEPSSSVMNTLRSSLLPVDEPPEPLEDPLDAAPRPGHNLTLDQVAFLDDWAARASQPEAKPLHNGGMDFFMQDGNNPSFRADPAFEQQFLGSGDPQKHFAAVAMYTKEMLKRPPTAYVELADSANTMREPNTRATSEISPMPSSFDTPQASEMSREPPHELLADTASAKPRQAVAAEQQAGLATPGPPGNVQGEEIPASLIAASRPDNAETPVPSVSEPAVNLSKTGGRPGKSRFASGPSKGTAASQHKPGMGKTAQKSGQHLDPSRNAVTAALAAHVAAGQEEGDWEAQWGQFEESADVLSMAPDDEILAEIYALQSELIQQMAINRRRAAPLLQHVLKDLPRQRAAAQARSDCTQIAKNWILKQRAAKRVVKREKREAAQREALKASEAAMQPSPRKIHGRLRGFSLESFTPLPVNSAPVPEVPMFDLLAERRVEDDALCAVCGGGESDKAAENEIVFCERCDVAVHQKCYNVDVIPSGEWLCWPCKKFEEAELALGKTQHEIRPPRADTGSPTLAGANRTLHGGGRTVPCALCPARRGAFRQTTDGKHWVHQVCAMWHPEPRVLSENVSEAIEGLDEIKSDRWSAQCSICRRTEGAVIRCNAGHCAAAFHPLCARNAGQHLTTRDSGTPRAVHRAYCLQHSEAQRTKDSNEVDGSAAFLRNQSRIKQHLDKVNASALEAHEVRREERSVLTRVRLELESLRILLQRTNKREKLKRDLLKATFEEYRPTPPGLDARAGRALGGAAEVNHAEVNGRGVKRKAADQQVEREVVMTPDEAAQTNDRLPKGFMYVRMNEFNATGTEPSGEKKGDDTTQPTS